MPPVQANQIKFQRNLRKWLLLGSLLILVFVLAQWFFNRASIEVVVENAGNGEITYQFKNQENQKVSEVKTTASRIKKSVSKGNYEVTVSQSQSNYFAVASTGSTNTVNATLETQKGRQFIGNQPDSCRLIKEKILLSYECGRSVESLNVHTPATESLPTLTKPALSPGEDILEGFIHTNGGQDILLIQEAVTAGHEEFSGGDHSPHAAFVVSGNPAVNLDLSDRTALEDLEGQYSYNLMAYKDGFIAYNDEISHVLYYENLTTKPQEIKLEDLSDERLKPQAIRALGQVYVVPYAAAGEEGNTTAVVYSSNKSKRFDFDKALNSVRPCGDQLLCGLTEDMLEVYSIKNEDPELVYQVSGVRAIENFGENNLLVVTREGIINLDIKAKAGAFQYRFGDYRYCGIQLFEDTYAVCVVNTRGGKSMLAIQQDQISDNIDQKVAALIKLKELDTISVYGDFIFISPDTGEVQFDPAQQGYVYDQEVIKSSNVKINQKIEDIGIDRNKYKIRNIFDD
jgi:hypothetical protein